MTQVEFQYTLRRADYRNAVLHWLFRSRRWRVYFLVCACALVASIIALKLWSELAQPQASDVGALEFLIWLGGVILFLGPVSFMIGAACLMYRNDARAGNSITVTVNEVGFTQRARHTIKTIEWSGIQEIQETAWGFYFKGEHGMCFNVLKRDLTETSIDQLRQVLLLSPAKFWPEGALQVFEKEGGAT